MTGERWFKDTNIHLDLSKMRVDGSDILSSSLLNFSYMQVPTSHPTELKQGSAGRTLSLPLHWANNNDFDLDWVISSLFQSHFAACWAYLKYAISLIVHIELASIIHVLRKFELRQCAFLCSAFACSSACACSHCPSWRGKQEEHTFHIQLQFLTIKWQCSLPLIWILQSSMHDTIQR